MQQLISEFLNVPVAAEADHRIANHLTLISGLLRMQRKTLAEAHSFTKEDAEWLLDDCARRIETVGRVHRLLAAHPSPQAAIDIGNYLRSLAEGIVASTSERGKYSLEADCARECCVRANDVAPIGLIVGELITNAVKYAHPTGIDGKIELHCAVAAGNGAVVTVSDDGVGLPEGFDPQRSGNIGFRMIRTLVERLAGEIEYDSSCLGLTVTLRIPVSAKSISTEFQNGR